MQIHFCCRNAIRFWRLSNSSTNMCKTSSVSFQGWRIIRGVVSRLKPTNQSKWVCEKCQKQQAQRYNVHRCLNQFGKGNLAILSRLLTNNLPPHETQFQVWILVNEIYSKITIIENVVQENHIMNSEIYITSTLATEKVPERFCKAYLTGKKVG